ncbi:hypothetical protein [Candidatus Soleaferrea massiliensis]|uniref:hypothetical protein n=1 Tax=Candidatus Soleaferrea massiliensis TaxID=1470354 RepID=UPI0012E08887|nr:hypothetical protein [Candidatus Soleaferrea massiliensis]
MKHLPDKRCSCCENQFCVDWAENHCILERIALDTRGQCLSCITVDIPEELLKVHRESMLKRFGEE